MQMSAITDRGMAVNLEFDLIQRAYRNEMRFVSEQETVVLQLEFWGFEVTDDRFIVGLSFGGVPHRLEVPLDAVTMFADPSVELGLQFQAPAAVPAAGPTRPSEKPAEPPAEAAEPPTDGGAEVVTLDRFRNKK